MHGVMIRFCLFFLSLVLVANSSYSQNAPVFSNFMFMKPLGNPASVGSEGMLVFSALYRAQWVGIRGAPSVQAFTVHSPLTVLNSCAGIIATNEIQGEERVTSVMLTYAYRHAFRKGSLAFGISGGIIQRAIDGRKLRAPEGIYEPPAGVDHNDAFIPDKLTSGITGEVNAGIFFQTKKMYSGISVANLIESRVELQGQGQATVLRNPRYLTLLAGYRIKASKKLYFLPNVSLKTDFINVQPELNAIFQYKDNIYAGASLRGLAPGLKDAFILMFGFKIFRNLRIGYSYDFSLSQLNLVNSGSHEIYLQYGIRIKDLTRPGKVIYNPRFL